MEESLIIEVWDTFREYIPEKNRETAAHQYVDFLVGKDVETAVLEGLSGYDPYLDIAIKAVIDEASEWEDQDDEGYFDGDEDY